MTATSTGLYRLIFEPEGDLLAATRACEAEVFFRTYGNAPDDFEAEYGPYESASHYIALAEESGDVVGACRLIAPGPAGLKTVNDLARPPWAVDGARAVRAAGVDLTRTWDVATLAVLPDRRVTGVGAAALYHGLVLATRANNVEAIVMMLDERARRLLSMVGFNAQPVPGTKPASYLGSETTTPLVGNVARMIDNQRRDKPDAHRLITLGIGMDGIQVPGLADFVVSRPSADAPAAGLPEFARIA